MFQNDFELQQLVDLARRAMPIRILEVGAWHGGTLWHWLRIGTIVAVVDDEMRMADLWREWAAQADAELHLIRGMSQDPAVVRAAAAFDPYDVLFIDADHSYEAVRRDWENYSPLVGSRGIVAFHDIVERPGYGVSRLWGEIKAVPGTRWVEIVQTVEPANESRCGIGVTWM